MIKAGMAATALALAAAAPAAAETQRTPALSLQELSDREEIRTLLLKYGRYLDDRDFENYANLFASNGQWLAGPYSPTGPQEIRAFMLDFISTAPNPEGRRNYHVMTNMMVDVDGDTATAWSHYTFFMPGPDMKPQPFSSGTYSDELIRENGEWKFLRRRLAANVAPDPEHGGQ